MKLTQQIAVLWKRLNSLLVFLFDISLFLLISIPHMSESIEHIGCQNWPNSTENYVWSIDTSPCDNRHSSSCSEKFKNPNVNRRIKDLAGTHDVAQFCLAHHINIKSVLGVFLERWQVRVIDRKEHEVINRAKNNATSRIQQVTDFGDWWMKEATIGKLLGSEQSTDGNRVALHGSQPTGGDEAIGG